MRVKWNANSCEIQREHFVTRMSRETVRTLLVSFPAAIRLSTTVGLFVCSERISSARCVGSSPISVTHLGDGRECEAEDACTRISIELRGLGSNSAEILGRDVETSERDGVGRDGSLDVTASVSARVHKSQHI